MTKEIVKEGTKRAEEELREKQVNEVKKIVLRTLEEISKMDDLIKGAEDKVSELKDRKKILRLDIEDLKEGRLDRIQERQEADPKAKEVSVVIIIKETVIREHIPYWYQPYQIIWHTPVYPINTPVFYNTIAVDAGVNCVSLGNSGGCVTTTNLNSMSTVNTAGSVTIDCSVAKFATVGTYTVDGNVINLR